MNLLKATYSFLALGLLFSCSDESSESNGNKFESSFLKKTSSQWNENDFYQVKSYQISNLKRVENNSSFKLEEGLLIEAISEEEYKNASQNNYRHYLKDTLALIKIDKSIHVQKTILTDKIYKNGSFEFYKYLGFFPVINQYLIRGEYLDSLDYKLVDKSSGQIKKSFISYPIISQNADFVTVCKTNELEKQTYFEIYRYESGFYKNAFSAIFTNWRVIDFEKEAFWSKDGILYLKVAPMNSEVSSEKNFLRITLN